MDIVRNAGEMLKPRGRERRTYIHELRSVCVLRVEVD